MNPATVFTLAILYSLTECIRLTRAHVGFVIQGSRVRTPDQPHPSKGFGHKIIPTAFLSLTLIQVGQLSVTGEVLV